MNIKEMIFSDNARISESFYGKMLQWLDNPKRLNYNNPDKLLAESGMKPGQTVLEIGCGSGFFTVPASKLLGKEGWLYAIDIHPAAVRETERKIREFDLKNVTAMQEDAVKTSFPDEMFDTVLLYGVVPAPVISTEEISREICRVLRPGGICAIWTVAPFWTPNRVFGDVGFATLEKSNNIFKLQKIG